MASFIKADTHITLVFDDGDSATVYSSDLNYGEVCKAVLNKNWDLAKILSQPIEIVKKKIEGIDKVAVEGGFVTYDGVPLHNTLTERMLEMFEQGFDISPLAAFLENLMDNPSYRAVNELYGFLENSELPITDDGHFLAYKRINSDFKDIHTGRIDNSVGAVVEMKRNQVDEDKDNVCSSGLHFCSRKYLPEYGSHTSNNKVIMVKINPADVVSIPSDYDNAKGRTCKYTVEKEMPLDYLEGSYMPSEHLEGSFQDTRNVVSTIAVEQMNLAEVILGREDPDIINAFSSPEMAMVKTNINADDISKVCNGERRSAGSYTWRWASDNPHNRLENPDDDDEDDDSLWPDDPRADLGW